MFWESPLIIGQLLSIFLISWLWPIFSLSFLRTLGTLRRSIKLSELLLGGYWSLTYIYFSTHFLFLIPKLLLSGSIRNFWNSVSWLFLPQLLFLKNKSLP